MMIKLFNMNSQSLASLTVYSTDKLFTEYNKRHLLLLMCCESLHEGI